MKALSDLCMHKFHTFEATSWVGSSEHFLGFPSSCAADFLLCAKLHHKPRQQVRQSHCCTQGAEPWPFPDWSFSSYQTVHQAHNTDLNARDLRIAILRKPGQGKETSQFMHVRFKGQNTYSCEHEFLHHFC